MLAAIAAVLLLQDAPFVPALQHGTKSVAQWIEELRHGTRPVDAIWSLYYTDDHSAEVIAALKDVLADSRPPECRMAADTVLCHWRVEHPLIPAEVYSEGRTLADFVRQFAPPLEPIDGPKDDLVGHLRSADEHIRVAAALALVLRGEEIDRATDELIECGRPSLQDEPPTRALLDSVETSHLLDWASAHLGSTYFSALARRFAEHRSPISALGANPDLRNRLSRDYRGATAALPWLEQLAAGTADERQAAGPLIANLLDMRICVARLDRSHLGGLERDLPVREAVDPFLEAHYLAWMASVLVRDQQEVADFRALHEAAQHYPAVAGACLARLVPFVERDDGVGSEALCILGALGSPDPLVRARYLRALRSRNSRDGLFLDTLPYWRTHDAETRRAFLELMSRCGDCGKLFYHISFARECDASTSEIARDFIERTEGNYHWLVSHGFRGTVAVDEKGPRVKQINQLALNIAAKKARGADFAEEERRMAAILALPYDQSGAEGYNDQVEWGLYHAQVLGLRSHEMVRAALGYIGLGGFPSGFDTHYDSATAYLESVPLELEDHVALRSLRGPDEAEPDWQGINLMGRQFGGEPVSRFSLQDVPRWRHRFLWGAPEFIAKLLRVTRLTEREVPYLTSLLERGTADQRLWALALVDEFNLDAPQVRDCLGRLADRDLDASVRRKAALLRGRAAQPR